MGEHIWNAEGIIYLLEDIYVLDPSRVDKVVMVFFEPFIEIIESILIILKLS